MTEIWDNLSQGEIVLKVVAGSNFLGNSVLATYDMSQRNNSYNSTPVDVCQFHLNEPAVVSLGWHVNIPAENSRRSMRVQAIHLYQDDKDVSASFIGNYENIQRKDEPNTLIYYRFGTPASWTVENYEIDNGGDGVKRGIDRYPGYNCLQLGRWEESAVKMQAADHQNSRLYQRLTLPEGRYYLGATYHYMENNRIGDNAYLFVADRLLNTHQVESEAMAYAKMNSASPGSTFYGIDFTLDAEQEVVLGWQMDSTPEHSEFRASQVCLLYYGVTTGINEVPIQENASMKGDDDAPIAIYNLAGSRLQQAPQQGIYIIRQGSRARKVMAK